MVRRILKVCCRPYPTPMLLGQEDDRNGQVIYRKDSKDAASIERTPAIEGASRAQEYAGDEKSGKRKKEVHSPRAELHHGHEPAGNRTVREKNGGMSQQDGDNCEPSKTIEGWEVATRRCFRRVHGPLTLVNSRFRHKTSINPVPGTWVEYLGHICAARSATGQVVASTKSAAAFSNGAARGFSSTDRAALLARKPLPRAQRRAVTRWFTSALTLAVSCFRSAPFCTSKSPPT
jgi:hypothetical protein